jgi:hypothetical protein
VPTTEERHLTDREIEALRSRNCLAEDWSRIFVAPDFDVARVYGVSFHGDIHLGRLEGSVKAEGGVLKRTGIYRATLYNTTVGNGVLINDVGGHISNYRIEDGVRIEGVGVMAVVGEATFGQGVHVEAVNEGGGRTVPIFAEMSSQFAYLLASYRYRPALRQALEALAQRAAETARSCIGVIGAGAVVRGVPEIVNVNVGPAAVVSGAALLSNGTILSEPAAPTTVGSGVVARNFIIGEGSVVNDGAILEHCFVGQGCRIGRQYSAENSLFFANCEGFHGEACSLFAGPYTVSHHKATLMIAAMFSFFNAGSGSNQSNHMYKLGPLHQGLFERGSKTGSFSYLLWPCRVGPFSVVLGKHGGTFDLGDFPFSYVTETGGKTSVVPGFNLYTVGTVRDGTKWPARDRRTGSVKRDLLRFDVLSPYTVGRMAQGEAILKELAAATPREVEDVALRGVTTPRLLLKTCAKYYATGIEMYLAGCVVARAKAALDARRDLHQALDDDTDAIYSERWVDVGGLLAAHDRLEGVLLAVESGLIVDAESLQAALRAAHEAYDRDAWAYVRRACRTRFGADPAEMTDAQLTALADVYLTARSTFLRRVLADARKEYDNTSRIGFGLDGNEAAVEADFEAVRGTYDTDKFVRQMNAEMTQLETAVADFKAALAARGG